MSTVTVMTDQRTTPDEQGKTVDALTEQQRAILDLEGQLFTYSGTKENRIRELFGWSAARYFQVLNALIDTEAAEAAYPVTVHRLRRLRDVRRGVR